VDVKPTLDQINLVVSDLERSLAFYRLLGVDLGEPTGLHVGHTFPNGLGFDLDQHEFAKQWNSGTPPLQAGSVVLTLSVPTREAVDAVWQKMVGAGYGSRQRPYDTFWGCRYAIVDDPDGYQIGLMSPSDDDKRYWPPADAPSGD
jgi:catechol 2,3-dioxygenase-like lactoylglutathione lyase family enzyme